MRKCVCGCEWCMHGVRGRSDRRLLLSGRHACKCCHCSRFLLEEEACCSLGLGILLRMHTLLATQSPVTACQHHSHVSHGACIPALQPGWPGRVHSCITARVARARAFLHCSQGGQGACIPALQPGWPGRVHSCITARVARARAFLHYSQVCSACPHPPVLVLALCRCGAALPPRAVLVTVQGRALSSPARSSAMAVQTIRASAASCHLISPFFQRVIALQTSFVASLLSPHHIADAGVFSEIFHVSGSMSNTRFSIL